MTTTLSGTGNPILDASWSNGAPDRDTDAVVTGPSVFPGTAPGTLSYRNILYSGAGRIINAGAAPLALDGGAMTVTKTGTLSALIYTGGGTFSFLQKPTITLTAGRLFQGVGWIEGRPNVLATGGVVFNQTIQTFAQGYFGNITLNGTAVGGRCDADGSMFFSVENLLNTDPAGPLGFITVLTGFIQVRGNIDSVSEGVGLLAIGGGDGSAGYSVLGKVIGSQSALALGVQTDGWGVLHGAQRAPGNDVSLSDLGYGFFIRARAKQTYAGINALPNWVLGRATYANAV